MTLFLAWKKKSWVGYNLQPITDLFLKYSIHLVVSSKKSLQHAVHVCHRLTSPMAPWRSLAAVYPRCFGRSHWAAGMVFSEDFYDFRPDLKGF